VKLTFKSSFLVAITLFTGLVILLGYFVQLPYLGELRKLFLQWFAILAAVAMIVGAINLANVHAQKIIHWRSNRFYSLVLLVSMLMTIALGFRFKPTDPVLVWVYNYIQMPVEASLMALLAIILAFIGTRLFRKRLDWFSGLFFVTVLIILSGSISLANLKLPGLALVKTWIEQIWAMGGLRGIVIGVGLGTIVTGLRVLVGVERPYEV
jgi:type IV secretory pathway VirB2 component (pilin)